MIIVFDKFDQIPDTTYERLFNLLPKSRKQLISQRQELDRKICIVEYFLLKKFLKFEGYPDFYYNENGKPYLKGYNFSISHCDNVLAISIADKDVGVDIEKIRPYDEKIGKVALSKQELQYLSLCPQKDFSFTKLFVQKEATIKMLGLNLTNIVDIISNKYHYEYKKYKNYLICQCTK